MCASIYKKLGEPFSNWRNLNNLCHAHNRLQFLLPVSYLVVVRAFSSSAAADEQNQSFVASYLINSCGLTPDRARVIVHSYGKLKFDSSQKPDSVISFFKNHGFTATQISNIVSLRPLVLQCNPEKTLLPKIEFFQSIGFSKDVCAQIFAKHPGLLRRDLENSIIPLYKLMSNVLQSDRKVLAALKLSSWGFNGASSLNLEANVNLLKEVGVPQSRIASFFTMHPIDLFMKPELFSKLVYRVREFGFDVSKIKFVLAIHALTSAYSGTRDRCFEVLRKWGWSEDEIQLAFRKNPQCIIISEEKLTEILDFLVNKMGYQSKEIAKMPAVLLYSLKKRLIPRCSVVRALSLMGLADKELSVASVVTFTEERFLEMFVSRHLERAPELLRIYEGHVDVFGSESTKLFTVKQSNSAS